MPSVVTLTEVKQYLNITGVGDDNELVDFLDDATDAVADLVGPLETRSVTEEIDEHGPRIVLSHTPVQSVQSVSIQPWLGAAAIDDTTAWRLNSTTGVLRRAVIGGSLPYYGAGSIFTITYTVGWTDVPGPVNRAILMQVRSMWKSQRGAMPLPGGAQDDQPLPYAGAWGFLAPEVMELLRPYLIPPGVA